MQPKLTVCIYSNATQNEQVITAARCWSKKNGYCFRIEYKPLPNPFFETAVIVSVNGKTLLVDNSDSPEMLQTSYVHPDVYFKRSFVEQFTRHYSHMPVYPLGLNYPIASKPFSWQRLKSWKKDKVYFFRAAPVVNRLANLSYRYIDHRRMHMSPLDNGGNILMLTRLWNPDNVKSAERKEARNAMNNMRITAVKQIIKCFGNRAIAGIENTPYARQVCPGLVVPSKTSSKKNYLSNLRQSDICVATNGLEDTLGWRIGEYVAFSKAVVTEHFNVKVPGLEEGKNYVSFQDNVVDKIDALLYGRKYLQLQQANYEYYREYLEPVAFFNRIVKLANEPV